MLPKGHSGHDRLYKIRTVVETLKNRFRTILLEECLSIDEQLCSTKARHYLNCFLSSAAPSSTMNSNVGLGTKVLHSTTHNFFYYKRLKFKY